MGNYYREIKPALNKLAELNIWDSLYVIRQYLNDAVRNYGIDRPHFENIERPKDYPIPLYLIDFLISATLRYSTTLSSTKSLAQLKQRLPIVRLVHLVYEKANKEHYDNILVWLKSYFMNQLKIQHQELFCDRVYKYLYLYSSPELSEHLSKRLAINVEMYFRLITVLYFAFSQQFSYPYDKFRNYVVGNGSRFTEEELLLVLSIVSDSLIHIKEKIEVDFSNKLFVCQNDAIHVKTPIIWDENMLYCTVPTYILNAGIEGLQYHLDLKSKENIFLNKKLAIRFEDYVGLQLNYFVNCKKYKFIKEITYKKGQNRTSDWIIYDDKSIVFLDCKLKKLTIDSIMETSLNKEQLEKVLISGKLKSKETIENLVKEQESSLIKDIIGLGVDLGKILCCYCDWKEGKIKELPPYNGTLHFTASILTLEESMCGKLEVKEYIDRIAYRYVMEKRNISLEHLDTRVISSIDFDKSIPYIAEHGLTKYIVENKYEIPDDERKQNSFLKEGFETFLYEIR